MLCLFCFSVLFLAACGEGEPDTRRAPAAEERVVNVPQFNADSAYYFIEKQVSFGPRVPNTPEHEATAQWLIQTLNQYADSVAVQRTTVRAFNGQPLRISNIIAYFKPEAKKRLLLGAHWDTRPFADQGEENVDEPILGANDGGSGVGVLLELARLFHQQPPDVGVVMAFFDAEDYGKPDHMPGDARDSYALGSQYWSKNLDPNRYVADWGILLDMVGAPNAHFPKEGYSRQFAPSVVREVWNTASRLGYGRYFVQEEIGPITDDHLYVNLHAKIPMIDIIDYDPVRPLGFGEFWHTHEDDLDIISRETLKAVGQTVAHVVYHEEGL